jgi:hypothetical protein
MLPLQFFGQNIHFAISLFAALVFFAVFWLYFDAWTSSREKHALLKCVGFLLVSLSFVAQSTIIEQSILGHSLLGNITETLATTLCIVGFGVIISGKVTNPLQEKPKSEGLNEADFVDSADEPASVPKKAAAVGLGSVANASHLLLPVGAGAIAWLYWRRATTGLERHLKPVAIAFGFITAYQLVSVANLWRDSDNPQIAKLVASFGPVWIVEQLLLLAGVVVLGWWVWRYLTLRFFSQLFMIFTSLTLTIFLLTTVSFTFLLAGDVQRESLNNLQTAANVLQYAFNGKKTETLANASAVADNPNVMAATIAKDTKQLTSLTSDFLHDKKQSSLIITSSGGQVLLRAEDPDRYGDSLSSDTLVRRALIGEASSSIRTRNGVLAPLIYIDSATPIRDTSGEIVGTVTVGIVVDNAFIDGIKHSTGLDSAVYAGNIRSATTFLAPDGVSRQIGVKDVNTGAQAEVLKKGHNFKGTVSVLNSHFLGVYQPLKDADNTIVGMIFIGEPQTSVLKTAGHSIELTFVVTALLLILAIAPAYLVAKYLQNQLD